MQFLLDDTSKCASPIETIDIPALTAGVWKRAELSLACASSDTAIISLAIKYTVDVAPDSWNIRLDDIRAIVPMIYKPKIMIPYQFRLLMFNLEEDVDTVGGGSYTKTFPVKFRYCAANDMHNWTGTGSGSRNMIQGAGS